MPQTTGAITKIEIVPPPGAKVAQDEWEKATPVGQDEWDTATPVTASQPEKTAAPADKGVFGQVVDYVKNAVGIPFEMVASMPEQALHHEDAIAGMLQSNQTLFDETYNAFKKGDVPMAAVKGFYYLLNGTGLGSLLNESGTDLNQGRIGAGLGKATAAGIMTAAPAALPFLHGALDKVDAYRATRATAAGNEAYQTNLRHAVGGVSEHGPTADVNDRVRMRPYLSVAHEQAPITNAETGAQGFAYAAKLANAQFEWYAEPFATDLLHTNPLAAAQEAIRNMEGPRSSDMAAGMDELASLGLDQPMSVSQAIGILKRLNAEEARHLSLPGATRANLEMHDPRFVANQAAMRTLRNDIYAHMADKGVPGVRQLRLTHGALIEHRNAAQRLIHSGQNIVEGVEKQSAGRKIAANLARYGASFVGGFGGPVGSVAARGVGDVLGQAIASGLTRDEAFRRAFANLPSERPTVAARPRPGPAPAPSHITVEPPEPPTTITVTPGGPPQLPPAPPRQLGPMVRPMGPIDRHALPSHEVPSAAPLSSLGTTLETPHAAPPAAELPVAAQGPVAPDRAVERGASDEAPRTHVEDRGAGGAQTRGALDLPAGYEADFEHLWPSAVKLGFRGTRAELAAEYRAAVEHAKAQVEGADLQGNEPDPTSHRGLLQAVADAGGISVEAEGGKKNVADRLGYKNQRYEKAGAQGSEVAQLREAIERSAVPEVRDKTGRVIRRAHLKFDGRVPGVKGMVVKQTGGNSFDGLLEALHETGRFDHIESIADLGERLRIAIREQQTGPAPAAATHRAVMQVLENYLKVTPDRAWWEGPPEEGDTSFNVDEYETGETQPRLPGDVGAVRDREVAQPQFERQAANPEDFSLRAQDVEHQQPTLAEAEPAPQAPRPREVSQQEQSYLDARANADHVAANPEAASWKDLRRAMGFLSHEHARLLHNAIKAGKNLDAEVAASYLNEIDYYGRLAKEKETARRKGLK